MTEDIKKPNKVWETYTNKVVREQVGTLLQGDHMEAVSEELKRIRERLFELFPFALLQQSPYYHALAGSSPKEKLEFNPDDIKQREIAEVVIGSLKVLIENYEPTTVTAFQKSVEDYIATLDEGLRTFVLDTLQSKVRSLKAQHPQYNLNSIPEIQFVSGGSEAKTSSDIPNEVVTLVMKELTREYIALIKRVAQSTRA